MLLSPVVDLSAVYASAANGVTGGDAASLTACNPTDMAPPFLLVLNAKTMEELARVEFDGVEWHRDIHGIFQPL